LWRWLWFVKRWSVLGLIIWILSVPLIPSTSQLVYQSGCRYSCCWIRSSLVVAAIIIISVPSCDKRWQPQRCSATCRWECWNSAIHPSFASSSSKTRSAIRTPTQDDTNHKTIRLQPW
jgi:hypothetical protein